MGSARWCLLLLGGAALLPLGCSGSSSHSLCYFVTLVSDPDPEKFQFYHVGYLDDQLFASFDVAMGSVMPRVPWIKGIKKDHPNYWNDVSFEAVYLEDALTSQLKTLRDEYNQSSSAGLHMLQGMYGCEVGADGHHTERYFQLTYNGEDFLSFNKEKLTWVAATPQALEVKRKLESEWNTINNFLKNYCVERLQWNLKYGNKTLQRKVPPTMKVARRKHPDGQETLLCRAHGFYPKEIEVTWMKDGVDQMQDTLTGGVVPNSDGTYHQWLSINVDPKDRDRYQCHVEHDGLLEPLGLAWNEPGDRNEPASLTNMELILGILVTVLPAAVLVGEVIYFTIKDHRAKGGYEAPADQPCELGYAECV